MYRHGALVLFVGLILCAAQARADDDALPPPPPPTAPDSIIPSSPTSPTEAPMEPPPTAPDRLPPSSGSLPPAGTLAPEDIPNPPVIPPTVAETPDTTEPGSPAPEPGKLTETEIPPQRPDKDDSPPPPPASAETQVKPDKELDKMLEPEGEEKIVEAPPPAPTEETPVIAEKEEPKPEFEAAPQITALERGRLRKIPAYQKVRPQWAFQFHYSPGALGNADVADASQGAKATGEQFLVEFQPKALQNAGVFGFGATLSIYPFSGDFGVTNSDFAVWSIGAQARYQARFFREQPIVPVVGFAWERLKYRFQNLGPTGATRDVNSSLDMVGPIFGVWFLLNIIEPNQASVAYLQTGLARSYLTAELRSMSGSDDDVDVSGNSYFVGIRVEF